METRSTKNKSTSFKKTYVLFAVCLVMVVGLMAWVSIKGPEKPFKDVYVFPSLEAEKIRPDDINTVEIERFAPRWEPEKLVFIREENGWRLNKPAVRTDKFAVDHAIEQLFRASNEDQGVDLTDAHPEKFGLAPPSMIVTMRKGVDKQWTLALGDESGGSKDRVFVYVLSSDRPKEVLAMRRATVEHLFKTLDEFRSLDLLTEGVVNLPDMIRQIHLQTPGAGAVVLEKDGSSHWRFLKPAEFGEADAGGENTEADHETSHATGVRGLLVAISQLQVDKEAGFKLPRRAFQGLRADNNIPKDILDKLLKLQDKSFSDEKAFLAELGTILSKEELKLYKDNLTDRAGRVHEFTADDVPIEELASKYGLSSEAPETLRIEIKRRASLKAGGDNFVVDTLLVGKKTDDKPGKYYARLESEHSVVKLPADKIDPILKITRDPSPLRDRNLLGISVESVDVIDIKNAEGLLKLRRSGTPETWRYYPSSGKALEADANAIKKFLETLATKRLVKEFPDPKIPDADFGFDKDSPVVLLWIDAVRMELPAEGEKEEKKDVVEPTLNFKEPSYKLTFGKKEKNGVWVRREKGDAKIVVLVPDMVLGMVNHGPLEYVDRKLPSFLRAAEVVRLEIHRGSKVIEVEKPKKDEAFQGLWKIKKPVDREGRVADNTAVDRVLDELRGLKAGKFVSDQEADVEKFGLKPPAVEVKLFIRQDDKNTEERAYLFGKENAGIVHAKQGDRGLIFTVSAAEIEDVLRSPLQFALRFDAEQVRGLKIHGWKAENAGELVLEGNLKTGWQVKAPATLDLDKDQFDAFLADLSRLTSESFVAQGAKPKLNDKERNLKIEITLEGEKIPVTLTIGALDEKKKSYFAQSSQLPEEVFLLPQRRFEKLVEKGPKYFGKSEDGK